jgi:DNA-directed RNA polymerase specialized sigma24 family protein
LPPLTEQQAQYARAYVQVRLKARPPRDATLQDLQDIEAFCLERLLRRWPSYNPARTTWRTYACMVLDCALADAVRWDWRQRLRLPAEPLEDCGDEPAPVQASEDDVLASLNLAPQALAVARLLAQGLNLRQIARKLKTPMDVCRRAKDALHSALCARTCRRA